MIQRERVAGKGSERVESVELLKCLAITLQGRSRKVEPAFGTAHHWKSRLDTGSLKTNFPTDHGHELVLNTFDSGRIINHLFCGLRVAVPPSKAHFKTAG